MGHYRVGEGLHNDEQAVALMRQGVEGLAALGLRTLAGSWAVTYGTDGFLPREMIGRFGTAAARLANLLVEVGLWRKVTDLDGRAGWRDTRWDDEQYTRAQLTAKRTERNRRAQLVRRPQVRAAVRQRDRDLCRYCGHAVHWTDRRTAAGGTYDVVNPDGPLDGDNVVVACRGCARRKGERTPEQAQMCLLGPGEGPEVPAPPAPLGPPAQQGPRDQQQAPGLPGVDAGQAEVASGKPKRRRSKGVKTPPPERLEITKEMREWAAKRAPHVTRLERLEDETATMLDWDRSKGNDYIDWVARWHNWMRRAEQRAIESQGRSASSARRELTRSPATWTAGERTADDYRAGLEALGKGAREA